MFFKIWKKCKEIKKALEFHLVGDVFKSSNGWRALKNFWTLILFLIFIFEKDLASRIEFNWQHLAKYKIGQYDSIVKTFFSWEVMKFVKFLQAIFFANMKFIIYDIYFVLLFLKTTCVEYTNFYAWYNLVASTKILW